MNVIKNEAGMQLYVFDGDKLSQLTNKAFGLGNKLTEAIGKGDQQAADAASNEYLELVRETLRTPAAAVDGAAARIAELEAENARLRAATPAGWKLVPVEASDATCDAGVSGLHAGGMCDCSAYRDPDLKEIYRSMVAAAPAAPVSASPHPAWKRMVLYTDTIGGKQTLRDDLWAITTAELNALLAASPQQAAPAELTDDEILALDCLRLTQSDDGTEHAVASSSVIEFARAVLAASHQAAAGAEGAAWIGVREQQPEQREPVVYCRPNPRKHGCFQVGIAYWTVSDKWNPEMESSFAPSGFTHWMPLPAAPSTSQPAREGE